MDEWIARQCTLINVAREKQRQMDFDIEGNIIPKLCDPNVYKFYENNFDKLEDYHFSMTYTNII